MATLTYKISVFNDGSIKPESPAPTSGVQWYRVPHDIERMDWKEGDLRYRTDGSRGKARSIGKIPYPEVYRLYPDQRTELNCYWQQIWKDINPLLSANRWSSLLGSQRAWNNNTGFPERFNCITGYGQTDEYPEFDAPRVCGGAMLIGKEVGDRLYIETMSVEDQSYTALEVMRNRHLWYWGTSTTSDGKIGIIERMGNDGEYHAVLIPLITEKPVWLPLNELHKWPIGRPFEPATYIE